MRKLKIGYWPLSSNLKSAGDRRRIVFWANARGHSVVTDLNQSVDLIVASENSDFNSSIFDKSKAPIVFDLVDAYLSPLNPLEDFARGFAKSISRQISGRIQPFSHHISDFCRKANAVICSSIEQEVEIKKYNTNTHVILDSHDEIPFLDPTNRRAVMNSTAGILWEGQPATIAGVETISAVLSEISKSKPLNFDFVTDEKYFRYLNKYLEKNTYGLVQQSLGDVLGQVNIIPWSPQNLVEAAKKSEIAIIPINLSVPMQNLKPENRLLIMWRLGLPCLTSPSPSYLRVSQKAGVNAVSYDDAGWLHKINRLLNDREFALNEILAGQNYLREYHNKTILLRKWDSVVESVMS